MSTDPNSIPYRVRDAATLEMRAQPQDDWRIERIIAAALDALMDGEPILVRNAAGAYMTIIPGDVFAAVLERAAKLP